MTEGSSEAFVLLTLLSLLGLRFNFYLAQLSDFHVLSALVLSV